MEKHIYFEGVKNILLNKGFEFIESDCIDCYSQVIFRDADGYHYSLTATRIKEGRIAGKFNISNPFAMSNIKLFCINRPFEILCDTYHGHEYEYELKCKNEECREMFYSSWDNIKQGRNCPYCCVGRKKVAASNCLAIKNKELIEEWHPTLNGSLTPFDVTTGTAIKIWWKCKNENHKPWKASIYSRTGKNGRGCPYCSGHLATNENNLLVLHPELIVEWSYDKNKKLPEEYAPKSSKKVWWKCNCCNENWEARIINRTREGKGTGCPFCSASKGEKRIRDFFKINNIIYKSEKEFKGLVGIGGGNLSYDFYLIDHNLLIEYQGEFHDGNGNEYMKQNLERQQEHDKRKRDYAQKNGIKLLEIWYWDFDNIENILKKALQL